MSMDKVTPCETIDCLRGCAPFIYKGKGPGFAVWGDSDKVDYLLQRLDLSGCALFYETNNLAQTKKVGFPPDQNALNYIIQRIKDLNLMQSLSIGNIDPLRGNLDFGIKHNRTLNHIG